MRYGVCANASTMPQGRPKQQFRTRYVHVTVKEITYGRWEQAKKTIPTNTDDSLANYLLDLYFNDLLSPSGERSSYLPRVLLSGQQCSSEFNKYVSFQYFMLDTVTRRFALTHQFAFTEYFIFLLVN